MRKVTEKDEATCFRMERIAGNGQPLHFHRCMEIYGVVKGVAAITVSGESRLLTDGQMAIVDRFENHSCETEGEAEILVVSVGTSYLRHFLSLYPNKKLPRWLTDLEFNKRLYEDIERNFAETLKRESELQKIGIVCQLLSSVIEHYGLEDKYEGSESDMALAAEIVQYIYAHCNEKITLETLSKTFYLSPTILSKKLRKRLGVDFRMFVNDIRVHKAVQMLDDPENKNKRIHEIAMMCGFSSMSTFYRCYKRNFSFRKLNTEEIQE